MILAVDIGNSNIVLGGMEGLRIVFEARIRTDATKTSDEYCVDLKNILDIYGVNTAALEGAIVASVVPQVLFVCVQNAGRSQIAAALLKHYAGDGVEVRSAGSTPGDEISPMAVEVLRDRGLDLTGAYPKPLTDDVVRAADYVITMGCGDVCPIYPGKHYLDWDLADPADQGREQVEAIVDEIDERVKSLWQTVR